MFAGNKALVDTIGRSLNEELTRFNIIESPFHEPGLFNQFRWYDHTWNLFGIRPRWVNPNFPTVRISIKYWFRKQPASYNPQVPLSTNFSKQWIWICCLHLVESILPGALKSLALFEIQLSTSYSSTIERSMIKYNLIFQPSFVLELPNVFYNRLTNLEWRIDKSDLVTFFWTFLNMYLI